MKNFKSKTKRILGITLIVIAVALFSTIGYDVIARKSKSKIPQKEVSEMLSRCQQNGYNQHYCIIVDYGRFVGAPRFFIFNFDKNKVIAKSIMSHGVGGKSTPWKADFSNVNASKCSCLGYFLVREYHVTTYGDPSFRVDGLDKGINDNARKRCILIHPRKEVTFCSKWYLPAPFGNVSYGCFVTDHKTFAALKNILKNDKTPLLLWAHK
ncbi:MAG: murein L,D-transpeptidase catalytic domain family protein [Prevotella sp.]|jgi:hypothetical protein|nr:murein L,D-transpeptidase catalytic domain family protein [Prevotella sp.]MCI1282715.1 murein L,D-transpeptidase catalytic domain family protein [Prevotella sp.]